MNAGDGILYKHRGMGFQRVVHDLALVVHKVLNGQRRGQELMAGAKMIELAPRQGQDGHAQLAHLIVADGGMRAQATAKLAIEVVGLKGG